MGNDLQSMQLIEAHLMEDSDVASKYLSETQLQIRERIKYGYVMWLESPSKPDSMVVKALMETYGISTRQAYADIDAIKLILGNIKNAHKEWHRYVVIEMCKKAFELAESNKDPKGMAMAADKLGKYTRLDQIEEDQLPWDQLIPPNFEPSTDITVLGFQHVPDLDKKVAALKRKYMPEAEDIEYTEVNGED